MEEPFRMHVAELSLQASVGRALFPVDGEDAASLLGHADEAMYEHKRNRPQSATPIRRLA